MSADPDAIAAEWPFVCMVVRNRLATADHAFVEDIASTVIEKALRRADQYQDRPGTGLRGWLTAIARTVTIDALRTARYRQHDRLGEFGRVTTDAGNDRHALTLDVRAALATLPDQQRAYLTMRAAGWEAYRACEALGVSRGNGATAWRFYSVAHQMLRAALEPVS